MTTHKRDDDEPNWFKDPPAQSPTDALAYANAWHESDLNAAVWWQIVNMTPEAAALLLCKLDPHETTIQDAMQITSPQTGPSDFKALLEVFRDVSSTQIEHRSLDRWRLLAKARGLKYHSWADDYAVAQPTADAYLGCEQTDTEESQVETPSICLTSRPGLDWSIKTSILRAAGYRWSLLQVLKAAHADGKPCPKAREVLDIWRINPPLELQILTDSVRYDTGTGKRREADFRAIQQAIRNLLN